MIFHSLSNLFETDSVYNHPVALRDGEVISFDKFKSDVASFAYKYQNCRAALLCEDGYYFLVGFFGLLYGNSSFLSSSSGQFDMSDLLKKEYNVVIDDDAVKNVPFADHPLLPFDADRNCIDFFTSGSTGEPKKVTKNIAGLEQEIEVIDSELPHKPGSVFSTIPHCHVYGLINKLLWPLASRNPFDVETYIFLEDIFDKLTSNSVIVSSPAHLRRIDGIEKINEENIPARVFSAGSELSDENVQEIKHILGIVPTEIFGSTETGTIAFRIPDEANKLWKPFDGISLRQDSDGRMEVLSKHMSSNWHTTDDLIELEDGGFRYLGRSDRIVKVECRRISLVAVESALCNIEYISQAAATLMTGKTDHLAAVVVLTLEGKSQLSEMGNFHFTRFLRKQMPSNLDRLATPRLWRFVDSIPTSGIGKPSTDDLRTLFVDKKSS